MSSKTTTPDITTTFYRVEVKAANGWLKKYSLPKQDIAEELAGGFARQGTTARVVRVMEVVVATKEAKPCQ